MAFNEFQELKNLVHELQKIVVESDSKSKSLREDVNELIQKLEANTSCPEIRRNWIPRSEVMQYFQLADTQMSAVTQKYGITYSQIGKRKFYNAASIQKLLEANKLN